MDAKAKIDEMLRRKRNGNGNGDGDAPAPSTPTAPAPLPPAKAAPAPPPELHGGARSRIDEMLKQKQAPAAQSNINEQSDQSNNVIALPQAARVLCAGCTGTLEFQAGLFVCRACRRNYIKGLRSELINVAELPFGHCQCCPTRAPLVKTEQSPFPVCAVSHEQYAPAAGRYLRLSSLPFGLCSCCRPANALAATPDRRILCPATGEEYIQNIDGSVVLKPAPVALPESNNIEAALNDGNAAFYYGGFLGEHSNEQPRRRRRR